MPAKTIASVATLAILAAGAGVDVGFEYLLDNNNQTHRKCFEWDQPSYLNGSFILPSIGQVQMGDMKMTGLLDGYGKFNRFSFVNGKSVCFDTTMMDTEFYKQSEKLGKVAPGILFSETIPKRGYSGMKNMMGPNDNTFVNSYSISGSYRAITDTSIEVIFDPIDLKMGGKLKWTDKLDANHLPTSSAHPYYDTKTGCWFSVDGEVGLESWVKLYKLCPDQPTTRVLVNKYKNSYVPYFHSFGLTEKYAIFPHQHFKISYTGIMTGKTLDQSFADVDVGKTTTVMIVPLDGSTPFPVEMDGEVYYDHVVNSFEEDENTLNFDFVSFGTNIFKKVLSIQQLWDKTTRDAQPLATRGVVRRMKIDLASKKASLTNTYSPVDKVTDFPKINPDFQRQNYCIFYSTQWWYVEGVYGSMAIVKSNICTGEKNYFYRPNTYPSEPFFVDDPSSPKEDVGRVILTLMDGVNKTSSLITLDASDMTLISDFPLDTIIGFTTHGEFYNGLLPPTQQTK